MDDSQPGLFDLPPDIEQRARPDRTRRGNNRQTWVRRVAAEVIITDWKGFRDARARAAEEAVTIEMSANADGEGADAEEADDIGVPEGFDALGWLIWPTSDLELSETGAFRVLELDCDTHAESTDRGILTWTVTVTLTDVAALRHIAARAEPDAAAAIEDSLAVAWHYAAEPYAPLRSVPWLTWRPREVEARHVPARVRPV